MTTLRSSTKTGAEEVLAIELAAAGYNFLRQVEYAPPRKLRADFLVYGKSGWTFTNDGVPVPDAKVLVEIQGGIWNGKAHGSIEGVLRDIDRLNEAACAGLFLLRFTPDDVDAKKVIPVIERFFEQALREAVTA